MKRSVPLTRTRMKRGRRRVGHAAAARRKAGGKLAVGRPSTSAAEWKIRKLELAERSGGICEVRAWVEMPGASKGWFECRRRATDPCHIIPRSAGGNDSLTNLYHGCRTCHRRQDAPYASGKLVPDGISAWDGKPLFRIVYAKDKFEARRRANAGDQGAGASVGHP